jgi:hypothetical protein
MDFTDVVAKIVDQNSRLNLIQGTVTAIGTYSVSVQLRGDTTTLTGIKYLGSYVPNVNDTVFLIVNKGDLLVLGKLASIDTSKSLNPVAYRTSSYTVTKDTNTYVPFEAVANDSWGMWSSGSPTVLTCKVPGRYQATASMLFTGQNNAYAAVFIEKGTQEIARQDGTMSTKDHGFHASVTSVPITLAINDTIRMGVHHDYNPSNALILSSGGKDHTGYFNALSLIYLGP